MTISKKWPVLGGLIFTLSFVFSGIGTKYLPDEIPYFGENKEADLVAGSNYSSNIKSLKNLSGKVPYLYKIPILDENLYIEQNYSELIFGGVNFKSVKFAARTDKGAEAEFIRVDASALVTPVYSMPYIEIEYQGDFYALEINSEILGPDNIELTYNIRAIKRATMSLRSYIDHEKR